MTGTIYTPGIIPFTLKKICDCKESSQKFTCSFVEIYNDELFDLLATKSDEKVKLYYKTIKHKLHIKNLTTLPLNTIEEMNTALNRGVFKKEHGSNNTNQNSSRSHAIISINLHSQTGEEESSLTMIDLAGHEDQSGDIRTKDKDKAKLYKETLKINTSLDCLKDVVSIIHKNMNTSQKTSVPFKKCKLTTYLMKYFVEESNFIMLTNINPTKEDLPEALKSLEFAQIISKICIGKEVNPSEVVSETVDLVGLQAKETKNLLIDAGNKINLISESEQLQLTQNLYNSQLFQQWESELFKKISNVFQQMSNFHSEEQKDLFLKGKRKRPCIGDVKVEFDRESQEKPVNRFMVTKESSCQTDEEFTSPTKIIGFELLSSNPGTSQIITENKEDSSWGSPEMIKPSPAFRVVSQYTVKPNLNNNYNRRFGDKTNFDRNQRDEDQISNFGDMRTAKAPINRNLHFQAKTTYNPKQGYYSNNNNNFKKSTSQANSFQNSVVSPTGSKNYQHQYPTPKFQKWCSPKRPAEKVANQSKRGYANWSRGGNTPLENKEVINLDSSYGKFNHNNSFNSSYGKRG